MTGTKKPKTAQKTALGPAARAAVCLLAALPVIATLPRPAHAQLLQALLGDSDDDHANPPANASTAWDNKRVQRLDRDVRRLNGALGGLESKPVPPVLLEPDPEVLALQATADSLSRKLDDNANTITRLTGQLEETQHQNQVLQQRIHDLAASADALVERADQAEAHLKTIDVALAPPPPPPPSSGDAESDFEQAAGLMTAGRTDDAERAFTAFTTAWPESALVPQAWLRLGDIHMTKKEAPDAVAAYASALKGWPRTAWAPAATVKLAAALGNSNRPAEACEAIAKFDAAYARMAGRETRAEARRLKAKNCR